MDNYKDLLKQVLRRLGRSPMFTIVTLITLAAGIGANTAVFSVIEGVLLKPLPYPNPDQLVGVWHKAPGLNIPLLNMAPSNYFIYREQNRTFQDVGIYQGDSVSITGVAQPEQVPALDITDGILPILGIPPELGRWFNKADDKPGAPDTAMLTYGYWRQKFGGDPSIVGRNIMVDGKPRQVIGVMPARFHFLDQEDPALLLPIQFDRSKIFLGQFSYEGIARLRPGATIAQANSDVARMFPIVMRSFPPPPGFSLDLFKKADIGPNIRPLKEDVVGDVGKLLWILMGSIGLVLLIACANVANLLLVRTEGRQQELAIRAALGAGRNRIAGELLFESVVLGLIGSVLGLALAWGAVRLLVALAPSGLPRLHDIGINVPVLNFTLIVSLIASLLFGAIPVLKYRGATLGTGLREGGRNSSQTRERHRARSVLVVVQVGLASVLLICCGLMIRTFRHMTQVNPGFIAPADVQTFRIAIPSADVPKPENVVHMEDAIAQKLAAIPGVSSVAMTQSVPMTNNHWMDPVFARDHDYAPGEMGPLRRFVFVSPGLFHTLGIPLIAGRDFTWDETFNQLPVAMVSENFARESWGSPQNALGKEIRVSTKDDWRQIVGVVGNVYYDGVDQKLPTVAYWPIFMKNFESDTVQLRRELAFAVRTPRAGSQSFMNDARRAVWSVDANLPLSDVRTLGYYYTKSMARTSFTLVMLVIAGAMALLLGAVGLYGVIAYSVSQRTREIGIRIALGAQRRELIGMFVRHGMILAAIGIACGLVVAVATVRVMSSLLFHVSSVDPVTYILVCVALGAAAALASYIPSRRASSVDPVEALRAE
ncbi:MAG TPA: ABC transporter permease [Candidatus Acidoferrales bacterium]|nr:ABC transporter permease [Candidatus Acidoferrales bacterium]